MVAVAVAVGCELDVRSQYKGFRTLWILQSSL